MSCLSTKSFSACRKPGALYMQNGIAPHHPVVEFATVSDWLTCTANTITPGFGVCHCRRFTASSLTRYYTPVQTIAFVHTVLGLELPQLRTVAVVVPVNTLYNWRQEVRVRLFALTAAASYKQRSPALCASLFLFIAWPTMLYVLHRLRMCCECRAVCARRGGAALSLSTCALSTCRKRHSRLSTQFCKWLPENDPLLDHVFVLEPNTTNKERLTLLADWHEQGMHFS